MWKVFPRLGLLKALLFGFSAIYFSLLLIYLDRPLDIDLVDMEDFGKAFSVATPATFIFLLIVFIGGKYGWILLWRAPLLGYLLNKNVCPDLNGTWSGEVQSNFDGSRSKRVEMDIKCDLLGFDVRLRSTDAYQKSVVVQSDIYRDPRTNSFLLSYVFQAFVPYPEQTDDRVYDGAAILEIEIGNEKPILKGTYWTNRAWQRGLNTAGTIWLTREP